MTLRDFVQDLREYLDEFCEARPLNKREKMRALKRLQEFQNDDNVAPIDSRAADKLVGALLIYEFITAKENLVLLPDAEIWEYFLSDPSLINELHYAQHATYRFLDDLPEIARRAATVRKLMIKRGPSVRTLSLCREAYQAYIYGFFIACVATLRSVLESELGFLLGTDSNGLAQFIKTGRSKSLYNGDTEKKMKRINEVANEALHTGKAPSPETTLSVLSDTQRVLDRLGKIDERR